MAVYEQPFDPTKRVIKAVAAFKSIGDEIRLKGFLGPSLKDNDLTPSVGVSAARNAGIIVDDAGKMRCPPGTPNANQFTDLQMSNCMIPGADAVQDAAQKLADTVKKTQSPDADRIRERNRQVTSGIADSGGDIENISREYLDGVDTGSYSKMTKQEHSAHRRKRVGSSIRLLKDAASSRDGKLSREEVEDMGRRQASVAPSRRGDASSWTDLPEGVEARKLELDSAARQIFGDEINTDSLSPELIKYLRDTPTEQIELDLQKAVKQFHEGLDPRARVQISAADLQKVIDDVDARYRTTHEVRSSHSGPDTRSTYEASWGISKDTPPEFRPASGYLMHKDWISLQEQDKESRQPVLDGYQATRELQESLLDFAGPVGIYGPLTVKLKPEVGERTRYGWGDSLLNNTDPVGMSGEQDADELMNALLSRRGRFDSVGQTNKAVLQMLDGYLNGNFSGLRKTNSSGSDRNSSVVDTSSYVEALVLGSFNLNDVESIDIPLEASVGLPREYFDGWTATAHKEGVSKLLKDIVGKDSLLREGATEEQAEKIITRVNEMLSKMPGGDTQHTGGTKVGTSDQDAALDNLMKIMRHKELKDSLGEYGVDVKVTNKFGLDRFNMGSFAEEWQGYGDPISVFKARFLRTLVSDQIVRDTPKQPRGTVA